MSTPFQQAMQYQNTKVQASLRPSQAPSPVAGKPWAYGELLRIWDAGKDVCVMCHSENYRDCIQCGTSGVYTPITLHPKQGGDV
jgi:hypothetical protein